MTPKSENGYLRATTTFLAGSLLMLGIQFYTQDKDQVDVDVSSVKQDIKETDKKVVDTKEDTLNKIYTLSFMTNEKISELQKSDIRAEGQYNLLSSKVDSMLRSVEENRRIYMSKFDAHDKRLEVLEKHDRIYTKILDEYTAKQNEESKSVGLFGGFKY